MYSYIIRKNISYSLSVYHRCGLTRDYSLGVTVE